MCTKWFLHQDESRRFVLCVVAKRPVNYSDWLVSSLLRETDSFGPLLCQLHIIYIAVCNSALGQRCQVMFFSCVNK